MKEWLKSVLNYRSYPKNKTGYPFFGPPCIRAHIQYKRSVRAVMARLGGRLTAGWDYND